MTYRNSCRVCLVDGAEHPIFKDIDSKNSIHFKLLLCLREKLEDVNGHPRNICESCKQILDIVHDFITKYKKTSKLLESVPVHEDYEIEMETEALEEDLFYMDEPSSNDFKTEILEDYWLEYEPVEVKVEPANTNDTQLKAKLKSLKEISVKKKSLKGNTRKRRQVGKNSVKSNKYNPQITIAPTPKKLPAHPQVKIEYHIAPVEGKTKPERLCELCGVVFPSTASLNRHIMTSLHLGKPTKCPQCPKILKCKRSLTTHLKYVHGEKKFICDHCGCSFGAKSTLNNHMKRIHLGKKFPCEKCDKDFLHRKLLIIHDKAVHKGVQPVSCSECGNSFLHKDYLKEHMRLHTGETPFKCPICDRGYAQRGNMKSHMYNNHRLDDLTSEQIKSLKPCWLKYLKQ